MIKTSGQKMTPRQFAAYVLSHHMQQAMKTIKSPGVFTEEVERMTDRERELVDDQLFRQVMDLSDHAITNMRIDLIRHGDIFS